MLRHRSWDSDKKLATKESSFRHVCIMNKSARRLKGVRNVSAGVYGKAVCFIYKWFGCFSPLLNASAGIVLTLLNSVLLCRRIFGKNAFFGAEKRNIASGIF